MKQVVVHVLVLLWIPWAVHAGDAVPTAQDPHHEARLKALAGELRCLVCQNQTLADSNAPLAKDLRQAMRAMIAANMSDADITEYLVARYGDFVLYRPPMNTTTVFLWVGPFLLLGVGLVTLGVALHRRRRRLSNMPFTDAERQRVRELLTEGMPRP